MMHFTAPQGWINDPYGVTWHNGEYHLFFQYVPYQNEWAYDCHWGHATSPDLSTWTYQGIALTPQAEEGCWSGTVVADEGVPPTMLYTSVRNETRDFGAVRIARPTDDSWKVWEPGEIVLEAPEGLNLTAFRDPYVFEDEAGRHLLMAAGFDDGTAAVLVFDEEPRSEDQPLRNWIYGGVFASRNVNDDNPMSMGTIWECPQLIKVGELWALIFSAMEPDKQLFEGYALGTMRNGRFTAQRWGRLTYGPGYYAGSAFYDNSGAPCMIHWIRNARDPKGAWVGSLSATHHLVIDKGHLTLRPYRATTAKPLSELVDDIAATFTGDVVEFSLGDKQWTMPANEHSLEFVSDEIALEVFGSQGAIALPR